MDSIRFLLLLALLFVFVLANLWTVLRHRSRQREMLSRERLVALEKGLEIPWEMDLGRPRRAGRMNLKAGVVLTGAGIGLAAASPFTAPSTTDVLVWAVFLFCVGLANVLYDVFVGKKEWERSQALDEELVRAYIRRLDAGTPARGTSPENPGSGR